jgi:glucarate dehydratase
MAAMIHVASAIPQLTVASDTHYPWLVDSADIIAGGKLPITGGRMRIPSGPGLGVALDRDKLARYHELFRTLGGYPYDRDPGRPGWYPLIPNRDWADPARSLTPRLD